MKLCKCSYIHHIKDMYYMYKYADLLQNNICSQMVYKILLDYYKVPCLLSKITIIYTML